MAGPVAQRSKTCAGDGRPELLRYSVRLLGVSKRVFVFPCRGAEAVK